MHGNTFKMFNKTCDVIVKLSKVLDNILSFPLLLIKNPILKSKIVNILFIISF